MEFEAADQQRIQAQIVPLNAHHLLCFWLNLINFSINDAKNDASEIHIHVDVKANGMSRL